MKGIMVMRNPSMPDIVFLTADKEFVGHMNQLAISKKLTTEQEVDKDQLDISIATHYFSPIVASYASLDNELHLPYASIRTKNDFLFVLKQCDDHLYIAVNGDGSESEVFLQRKLQVLHRLVEFYYGPISDQLRPESVSERQRVWEELARLIDTWTELYGKEQCFLVEAIERLQVNQTVNEICIGALETVLRKFRSVGEKYAVHAMLMVDAKLLALYSSRKASELQSSDILITTLLATSFCHTKERLQNLLTQSMHQYEWPENSTHNQHLSSNSDEYLSAGDGGSDDGSSYYSTNNDSDNGTSEMDTVLRTEVKACPAKSRLLANTEDKGAAGGGTSSDSLSDCEAEFSKEAFFTPPVSASPSKPRSKSLRVQEAYSSKDSKHSAQSLSVAATVSLFGSVAASENLKSDRRDFVRMPAFLQLPNCSCAPHVMQFVPVLPGTTMVIVSQVRVQLAKIISNALYIVNLICQRKSDVTDVQLGFSLRTLPEALENVVKQICEHAKKFKTSGMLKHQSELKECWQHVKRFGLQGYLDTGKTTAVSPRLEAALSEMNRLLKVIFKARYFNVKSSPESVSKQYAEAIKESQYLLRESLFHYQQYLTIKAQRNITMTTYLEDFPGLVHFIHVDRKTDQITAPSLGASDALHEENRGQNPAALVKEKVWSIVPMMHEYLMQGNYTAAVRQGDFYFSYYLYFEDVTGKLVAAQRQIKMEHTDIPGILTGTFFKDLVHRCFPGIPPGFVRCCELLCIHLSVVPIQYVTAHARRLCASLWETSGEVTAPVNLL
ncbi:Hermansky-Pudlak syndrome 1 protein homolog [Patiria miniata]|uniref:Hermansky-Pudlak syndrome 1 protein n=1 Tax=Patiria miniata TaxID=46514 RepID=A0A914AL26_PATMI|nr:Hermansky-Pudlak syndrome 1 protein homolog [Patiria miniata]